MTESEALEYVRKRFGDAPEITFRDHGQGIEIQIRWQLFGGLAGLRKHPELKRMELEGLCDVLAQKLKDMAGEVPYRRIGK